jgi:hypothetical protein
VRRQTVGSRVVRYGLSGFIAGCLVLCLAASAFAGGLSVKSHYWEIGINDGPNHKVAAGGTFKYCASKTVGAITPKVVLSTVPVGEEYSFDIAGPAAAGASLATEAGSFTGQGTVIDPAFIPLAFPKLKAEDATAFPPGSYRFTLTVAGATALTEKVKIVRRAGC